MLARLLLLFFCLSINVSAYAGDTDTIQSVTDKELLGQAIEDVRFGDFDIAMKKLETLQKMYPENAEIHENLGNVYTALNRFDSALSLYTVWLNGLSDKYAENTRFAWLGKTTVYAKQHNNAAAIKPLEIWLKHHPIDNAAVILYSSLLIAEGEHDKADNLWNNMFDKGELSSKDKAVGYYYKSLNAYEKGDVKLQKEYALESLKLDESGAYTELAKAMFDAKPIRELGLNVGLSLEEFYTSNVDLLPDFKTSITGQSKEDMVTQVDIALSYNFEDVSVGYIFNEGFHAKKEGFDFAYHTAYMKWGIEGLHILPLYEYAQFGGSYIFQGVGSDIIWEHNGWQMVYSGKLRKYSSHFNGTDLSRLAGWINELNIAKSWHSKGALGLLYIGAKDEAARGDVTVARSDAYRQASIGAEASWRQGAWQVSSNIDVYARKYREKNPISTEARRRDTYTQLQAKLIWYPDKSSDWNIFLNAGWQQNVSNNREKSYVEWHSGSGLQAKW